MSRAHLRQLVFCSATALLQLNFSSEANSLEKSNATNKSAKLQRAADALKSAVPEQNRVFCAHPSPTKKPGWILEIASKDMGTCRYFVTEDGFKIETPMCMMFGNFKTGMAAVANLETQKYFVFPLTKTKYYLSLMGMSIYSKHDSKFDKEFKQSEWKKVRDLKFEDLPATEFERHVLNPPRGRTRIRYQLLTHLPDVPNRMYEFYHDLMQTEPAMPNSIAIDDRVEITNPTLKWKELSVKKAQRVSFSEADLCVPNTLHSVDTIADVTIGDTAGGESRESLKSLQRDAPNPIYKSRPK
jgi:hypothetical protein